MNAFRSSMTLIEGFGDEVTLLLSTTVIVVVLYLVWMSTYVPDRPLLYAQLSTGPGSPPFSGADMQGFNRFPMPPDPDENLNPSPSSTSSVNLTHSPVHDNSEHDTAENHDDLSSDNGDLRSPGNGGVSNGRTVFNVAVSSLRSFASQVPQSLSSLRQRRVRNREDTNNPNNGSASETNNNNNSNASNTNDTNSSTSSVEGNSNQFSLSTLCLELPGHIVDQRSSCYTIKLKFLNDLQAEVEVLPSEKLSEFKSRVFRNVLSDGGQVRLIFAGGLLRDETQCLVDCGILSNCVVHCQVLTQAGQLSSNSATSNGVSFNSQDTFHSENIDLSNLLFLLFAVFLLVLWYLRFSYRHLFTPPTTFTLIAITVLFLLAVYASFIL
ncbi:uncharacterized protein LOC142348601 isoform X2 [Convolutriloba macropyga]|uniref:uncharacterized protein LOC142348601 isoform X2 n=1 Tax=Convolutriloba macropyga TaxID=536237 RepID=UPI003F521DE5